jgi:hypothetical protein
MNAPAYGLWGLVALNSAVFLLFAFSFFKPQSARDWAQFWRLRGFVVALFVEMYGFPDDLPVGGWLQTRYPGWTAVARHRPPVGHAAG